MKLNPQPLHILHVLNSFGPGGAEIGVVRLTKQLTDNALRHSVCSFSSDVSMQSQLPETVSCHSLNTQGRSYFIFWKLVNLIRSNKVDIVHVNNLGPWLDAFLASRLAGVKCIATFHGIETSSLQLSFIKRKMYRMLAAYSSSCITVSMAARSLLEEITGAALPTINVISNGVDCSRFSPPSSGNLRTLKKQQYGIPERSLVFGCVAALRPVKNHMGLIQSFADCVSRYDNKEIYLVLAGIGPEEKKLKKFVFSLGLESHVFFLGQCFDVNKLLQAFDVFCLNSLTEGMSYSILEAMAAGLPVVATDVGSNGELIHDGVSGFLYPSTGNDHLTQIMHRIVSTPEILKLMGHNAREQVVANYSFAVMAETYRKLYSSVVYGA